MAQQDRKHFGDRSLRLDMIYLNKRLRSRILMMNIKRKSIPIFKKSQKVLWVWWIPRI